MKKRIITVAIPFVFIILIFVPYCCEREEYRVLTLAEPNPVSYTYNIEFDSIFALLDGWKTDELKKMGYTYREGRREPEKSNGTIELYGRFAPSLLYRSGTTGLDTYSRWCLYCDSVSRHKTKITVKPICCGVLTGWNKYLWANRKLPWIISVASSTIEEYRLLRLIGELVEEKGMPEIHYPEGLTEEEIVVWEKKLSAPNKVKAVYSF